MSHPPPYGQQPPSPGWQQPPPGWQPGPYGGPPAPKRSRTPLVIALVAAAVLVIGLGIALAVVLAAGEDDSGPAASSDSPSEPAEPSEAAEPSGTTAQGSGYSYELPEGWQDVTEATQDSDTPGSIDQVSAWGSGLESGRGNVIVETGSSGGETDLEELRAAWESNMSNATGDTPETIDGTMIGDEEAIGARFDRTNENDVEIVQIAYLAERDGQVFSVVLSVQAVDEDEATAAFEQMLGSWTWE